MTRFALGAKCGTPGRPAARASPPRSVASAPTPMPLAVRPTNSRRVIVSRASLSGCIGFSESLFRNDFIQVQDHARDPRVRRQLGGVELLVARRLAGLQ